MNLHFRALGGGPPLVILHWLLGSLDNWWPVGQKLAAHFRVYLLDLRNHGRSPHAETFGYDEMAGDLRAFLNQHGVETTHVLGHSMGGKVAMRFAQLHPNVVHRLVVVDIAPREYPPRYRGFMDALLAVDLAGFQRRDQVDEALRAVIPDQSLRQFLLKNLGRNEAGGLFWKTQLKSIRADYDSIRGGLPDTAVHCPTLFIRGENSDYLRPGDAALIRERFRRVRVETIRGAGHWVHADQPDQVVEVVTQFLLAKS
jgi:pimeloyl-ACP methyl ester carboxylesterase